jgi:hypothetical protein
MKLGLMFAAAGFVIATSVALVPGVAMAQDDAAAKKERTAIDLLFNEKHLKALKKGNKLVYRFKRDVNDASRAGEAFDDTIDVGVTKIQPDGAKNIRMQIFTGERARNPFKTPGMTGNPLLMWYLDRAVATYRLFAGGSVPYLKTGFRNAMRDAAEVTPAKMKVNGGAEVDGYRIKLMPYQNDAAKDRMQGFEKSTFEITVSDDVPGFFHTFTSNFESGIQGAPKVTETIELVELGEIQ